MERVWSDDPFALPFSSSTSGIAIEFFSDELCAYWRNPSNFSDAARVLEKKCWKNVHRGTTNMTYKVPTLLFSIAHNPASIILTIFLSFNSFLSLWNQSKNFFYFFIGNKTIFCMLKSTLIITSVKREGKKNLSIYQKFHFSSFLCFFV